VYAQKKSCVVVAVVMYKRIAATKEETAKGKRKENIKLDMLFLMLIYIKLNIK